MGRLGPSWDAFLVDFGILWATFCRLDSTRHSRLEKVAVGVITIRRLGVVRVHPLEEGGTALEYPPEAFTIEFNSNDNANENDNDNENVNDNDNVYYSITVTYPMQCQDWTRLD